MLDALSDDAQTSRLKRPNQVLVRFDDETYEKIQIMAKENDISVATAVRVAVVRQLRDNENGIHA